MNINESGCRPYGLASALIVIGVSAWYPDTVKVDWKAQNEFDFSERSTECA